MGGRNTGPLITGPVRGDGAGTGPAPGDAPGGDILHWSEEMRGSNIALGNAVQYCTAIYLRHGGDIALGNAVGMELWGRTRMAQTGLGLKCRHGAATLLSAYGVEIFFFRFQLQINSTPYTGLQF